MQLEKAISVTFRPAKDTDMYDVMDIRNEGREWMTHNTDALDMATQYDWWTTRDVNMYRIWMVTGKYLYNGVPDGDEYVLGFCMIRSMMDGYDWGTLALYEKYRRQGIGTIVYTFMAQQVSELWIEVRNNNIASLRAAEKAGFIIHHQTSSITTLVKRTWMERT